MPILLKAILLLTFRFSHTWINVLQLNCSLVEFITLATSQPVGWACILSKRTVSFWDRTCYDVFTCRSRCKTTQQINILEVICTKLRVPCVFLYVSDNGRCPANFEMSDTVLCGNCTAYDVTLVLPYKMVRIYVYFIIHKVHSFGWHNWTDFK